MHILVCPSINFNLSIFIDNKGKRKVSVDESVQKYKRCKKITGKNLDVICDDLDGRITNLEELFKWAIKETAGEMGKKYSSPYDVNIVFGVYVTFLGS